MSAAIVETVTALVEPLAAREGLEVVDVTFTHESGRWYLRVFIDKPGGVGVDDCERLSEVLSPALDEKDPIPRSYYLEVSSPGLDRPLKRERDFERFRGRRATVRTRTAVAGRRRFTGVLGGLSDGRVKLDLGAEGEVLIPREEITQAKLVPEIGWEGKK
ncbi:MAG TPA: ribosome maturation factor RimP [Firmicutes bacterium]|jgi:ribosome maturation factor RimP|uniref:ribosome maturation factor RimP n=1 Tax=Gelria sp. Kuro-4 TaxID=2796927 RepID=UPI0019C95040|nr:ribosome maturation factor RimP [Gelria sp. Kuro-4]MDI3522368.1 ribosome maturation factor RimP [Bacillota bacterium]MDK2926588.1 ribosome maturation factor RimP [Bacillota bacterium]BCV24969.1 ribosome maturation factor RimP [Gelria sp. Kuro-4]HHV56167.1 ribosome maturation factor RimP [Bacillota bacterium]